MDNKIYKLIETCAFHYSKDFGFDPNKESVLITEYKDVKTIGCEPHLILIIGIDLHYDLMKELLEMPMYQQEPINGLIRQIQVGPYRIRIFTDHEDKNTFSLSLQKYKIL